MENLICSAVLQLQVCSLGSPTLMIWPDPSFHQQDRDIQLLHPMDRLLTTLASCLLAIWQGPTVYLDPKRVQGCLVSVVLIMTPGIGCTEHHPLSRPLHSGPNPQMQKEAALQTAMTERESGSGRKKRNGKEKEKKGTLLLGRKRRIKTEIL